MQLATPDNIVLASGRLNTVREFVNLTAQALDMKLEWHGEGLLEQGIDVRTGQAIVRVNPEFYRPYDPAQPLADIQKAKRLVNWAPTHSLADLVAEMVQFDLQQISSRP